MKTLTKAKIQERLDKSKIPAKAQVLNKETIINGEKFNRILKITIPGRPIQANVPRFASGINGGSGHTYNPNKANLMKIFDLVYKEFPLLDDICIMSPLFIKVDVYVPIPKTYFNQFKKDKNAVKKLTDEKMNAFNKPDNDNYEKGVYDVLSNSKYQIILRDETIFLNQTQKFFIQDEAYARTEVEIIYSDNLKGWYWDLVKSTPEYMCYIISSKYMRSNKIPKDKWGITFYQNLAEFLIDRQSSIKISNDINYILTHQYSVDELKLIYNGPSTTRDAMQKAIINTAQKLRDEINKKKSKKGKK